MYISIYLSIYLYIYIYMYRVSILHGLGFGGGFRLEG